MSNKHKTYLYISKLYQICLYTYIIFIHIIYIYHILEIKIYHTYLKSMYIYKSNIDRYKSYIFMFLNEARNINERLDSVGIKFSRHFKLRHPLQFIDVVQIQFNKDKIELFFGITRKLWVLDCPYDAAHVEGQLQT